MNSLQSSNCTSTPSQPRQRRSCPACSCCLKAAALFAFLLAAALGLIFGAVYAEQILAALPAVIVFAVIMGIATIALLLYRLCDPC